ncbi:MAG: sugar phosphate isomerase/epimerase [Clostridiales bacterium]|jgi:sugar phosphate isomerase/epimerase|nr:sugar phosphate isomerase/epimerase [Clostridiales bacterium]
MPKFGVSIYSISRLIENGTMTPVQGVEWLCENGVEVIEIVPFGIDLLADASLAGRLKNAAAKYGVPIDNYSVNADFVKETEEEFNAEIDRAKKHLDAAAELGIKTFRCDCAGFRRPIEMNTIENFVKELPGMARAYEALCAYAKKYNITILNENHGFHANGCDRVRLLFKNVKAENFGHQLDVGNYACVDDIPEIATKKMLPFATTVHMKDFYIRQNDPGDATQFDCSGSWFRSTGGRYLRGSILGQGDMNIPEILKVIKATGYDGNFFIEFEGMEDCLYGTKVSLDNLKRIYKEA